MTDKKNASHVNVKTTNYLGAQDILLKNVVVTKHRISLKMVILV